MLFNIHEIRQALVDKFGEAVIYFQELSDQSAFIINPSYQLCVFNYLLYEKKWRFDTLKDVVLSFNPGNDHCEYSLVYQLSSRFFQNKLQLLLPVQFPEAKVFSLSSQYKAAAKFETEMASIYQVEFVVKPSKFNIFKKKLRSGVGLW
jgi:NADH:ubiquinone oxidoreductase subunit C